MNTIRPILSPSIFYLFATMISMILPSHFTKSRNVVIIYSTALSCAISVMTFFYLPFSYEFTWLSGIPFSLVLDGTSAIFFGFLNFVLLLFFIYSSATMSKKESALFLLTAACSNLVIISADLFVLIIFWGIILITLYLVLQQTSEKTAQKSLLVLGITDFAMLLGIVAISKLVGSYNIQDVIKFLPQGKIATISLVFVISAAIAKAGSVPFHNWIISAAETSSVKTLIIFPAMIDKILGIYLLARLLPVFVARSEIFQPILLIVGAVTLIYAVLMALVQHNLKKLLSYHMISQVGYMLLGLGSFNPIGVLGGVMHMFNHVIYKSGLVMGAGAVELQTGTTQLDKLGSLTKKMPKTFISMIFSSAAISGIPPFNGFVSKWLIFQGLIVASSSKNPILPVVALIVAMFGSSLTLASFLKVIYSVFLTKSDNNYVSPSVEKKVSLWFPQMTLAFISLSLGLVATFYVGIPLLVETAAAAVFLVVVSLVIGLILFQFKISKKFRRTEIFFGGEEYKADYSFSGGNFYKNIESLKFLKPIYGSLSSDSEFYSAVLNFLRIFTNVVYYGFERVIYAGQLLIVKFVAAVIFILRVIHTGELYVYISWFLVGFAALFWMVVK